MQYNNRQRYIIISPGKVPPRDDGVSYPISIRDGFPFGSSRQYVAYVSCESEKGSRGVYMIGN